MAEKMTINKTVLRVSKLKKSEFFGSAFHSMRKNISLNIDTKKTKYNHFLIGSNDIKNDVISYIYNNKTDNKKIRKDAVYCEELILSASPDFFKKNNVKKWAEEQVKFLKKEYNKNCVSAVLHLDEQTPHIHAFVVPIVGGKLTHKAFNQSRGGKFSYTQLQDRYEAFNSQFSLSRTKRTNLNEATRKDIKQHYKNIITVKNYLNKAINKTSKSFKKVVPKGILGFCSKKEVEHAIKKIANSNIKELTALKIDNIELKDNLTTVKMTNTSLSVENTKLKKTIEKQRPAVDFYNYTLKYNLLDEFKKMANKARSEKLKKENEETEKLKKNELEKAEVKEVALKNNINRNKFKI